MLMCQANLLHTPKDHYFVAHPGKKEILSSSGSIDLFPVWQLGAQLPSNGLEGGQAFSSQHMETVIL